MRTLHCAFVVILAVACEAITASAQWTSQTIQLRPGWNAVFLEVQPQPANCDTLFSTIAVESAWMWNRRFSSVQFIQDPNQLLPGDPDWLTYLPSSHPARPTINLYNLLGARSYLIKLSSNSPPVSWSVHGRVLVRRINWLADSLNFVGFLADSTSPPTFQSFFAGSPAHAGQPVYRLLNNGIWQRILNPATARMSRGEAFWIKCSGPSSYSGPLTVTSEQSTGLDYGSVLVEQPLRIRNTSATNRNVTITPLPSENPASTDYPPLAGAVPLSYWNMDFSSSTFGWIPLQTSLANTLAPGAEWPLRLEVRRPDMVSLLGPDISAGALYQTILEVIDGAGSRYLLPVTAKGRRSAPQATGAKSVAPGDAVSAASIPIPSVGLWVGSAVINQVNRPASRAAASYFAPSDFPDITNLVQTLSSPNSDPISQYLWPNFSLPTKNLLTDPTSTPVQMQSTLAEELNGFLQQTILIFPTNLLGLAGIAVTDPELIPLLATPQYGESLARLNRLLIETAYPSEVQKSVYQGSDTPIPTASSFQFRLIVHVDTNTPAILRLLQHVTIVWKNGTYTNDLAGLKVVNQPGRYVLLADDKLIYAPNGFSGVTLQDGQPVPRRFSSPAFGFPAPIQMAPSISTYTCSTTLDFDHPLNPFKHLYHPQHDNLDTRFEQKLDERKESFSVGRQIQLQFTATDPANLALAGWGDTQVGGNYNESITGLHKDTLFIQGTFRLQRVSRVGTLNDGIVMEP